MTGTDGSTYTLQASGGIQPISPAATTTYTATATGAGGKTSASTTVTVTPVVPAAPTVSITANPTTILAGNGSTLTVGASNATQVTVTGTDGSSYTLQANGGTQIVSPIANTTYTATATGAGGNATAYSNRYSDTGSGAVGADRQHRRQSYFDHVRQLLHLDSGSGQRHRGDDDRRGWQLLHPNGEWRNPGSQPDGDHDIHGNRNWSRWQDLGKRHRDRDPAGGSDG